MVDIYKQELVKRLNENIKAVNYEDFIDNINDIKDINCCGDDISSITDVIKQFDLIIVRANSIISMLETIENKEVDDLKLLEMCFLILSIRTELEDFEENLNNM